MERARRRGKRKEIRRGGEWKDRRRGKEKRKGGREGKYRNTPSINSCLRP